MSLFDSLKKTITDLPVSDIIKARLEFVLEQRDAFAVQIERLNAENAELKAEIKLLASDRDEQRRRHDEIAKEHEEEAVLVDSVELRRGRRTEGRWLPFCAVCRAPMAPAFEDALACIRKGCDTILPITNDIRSRVAL